MWRGVGDGLWFGYGWSRLSEYGGHVEMLKEDECVEIIEEIIVIGMR